MIFRRLEHASRQAGCPVYAAIENGVMSASESPPADLKGGRLLTFSDPGALFEAMPDEPNEQQAWGDRLIAACLVSPRLNADEIAEMFGPDRLVIARELVKEWHVTSELMPTSGTRGILDALSSRYRIPPHQIARWRFAALNFDANVAFAPQERPTVTRGIAIPIET